MIAGVESLNEGRGDTPVVFQVDDPANPDAVIDSSVLVSRVVIDGSTARLAYKDLTVEVEFLSQPIAEGRNGATIEDLLAIAQARLQKLNAELGCAANDEAIKKIADAIAILDERTRDRRKRVVEGTGQV